MADRCETDDECAQYFTCRKEGFGMGEGCAAPADPDAEMPECTSRSVEYESKYGDCVPGPIDCETDSDCPAPLTCVEFASNGVCWESSDGESGCSEGTVERHCEYDPPSCERDADCEEGSECVEAGESINCDDTEMGGRVDRAEPPPADAGAPAEDLPTTPACPEGDDECENTEEDADGGAPDVEPDIMPAMPECETVVVKICFPERVDCTDDDQCAAGETCTDFSEMDSSPSWWEDGETAIACMPEGLVMAIEGHTSRGVDDRYVTASEAALGSDPITDSAPTSANQSGGETGVDSDKSDKSVEEEGENAGEEDNGDDGGETIGMVNETEPEADDDSQESSDGGCSIARRNGTSSSSWLLLIASVLGLRLIRRRQS